MLSVLALPRGVLCLAPDHFDRERAEHTAAGLFAALARREGDDGAPADSAELGPVWLKGGPLVRHGPWRHGLAWRALGRLPPRLREAHRLLELERAGIQAARPLFAAARFLGSRCALQGLALVRESGATPLARALGEADALTRGVLVGQCAELVARLHGAGFEHGDLYVRNLLVVERGGRRVPILIDLWRGGRRAPSGLAYRARARDLGQWFLEGALCLSRSEQGAFLAHYADAARADLPSADRWHRALQHTRRRELGKALRDPRRGLRPAGAALQPGELDPQATWSPPTPG